EAMRRLGVDPAAAHEVAELLTTTGVIGEIEHQGRRLRVRLAPDVPDVAARAPTDNLRDATVRSSTAPAAANGSTQPVPLALLGKARYVRLPASLRVEKGELCAYIYVDLADGVDIQSYVDRARREVDGAISAGKLPLHGERIEWTGQYDLLVSGQRRLFWIVPIVALSMLGLLFLQFRSLTEALLVLISVPFALVGSFWTLYLLGYPMSA